MPIARQTRTVGLAAWFAIAVTPVALAQSRVPDPAAPSNPAEQHTPSTAAQWRVASGYGWFALRDIARTGQPVDASPVEWHGQGITFEAARTRTNGTRVHRLDLTVSLIGDFQYRSPLATVDLPSADRYRDLEGRYEYRRYFLSDFLMNGLDVGIGAQALGLYSSLSKHVGDITAHESSLGAGVAVVAAARLRRWSAFHAEVAWTNGGRIQHLHDRHSESPETSSNWGGGWLTNLELMGDVRLTRRTALAVRYVSAGEGLLAGHRNAALSHGSLSAGVTYAK